MAGINNAPPMEVNNISAEGICGGRRSIWSNSTEPTITVSSLTVLSVDRAAIISELDEPNLHLPANIFFGTKSPRSENMCSHTFIYYRIRFFELMTSWGKLPRSPRIPGALKQPQHHSSKRDSSIGRVRRRQERQGVCCLLRLLRRCLRTAAFHLRTVSPMVGFYALLDCDSRAKCSLFSLVKEAAVLRDPTVGPIYSVRHPQLPSCMARTLDPGTRRSSA